MKKTTGPGKGKPMMKDMKPAMKMESRLALKKEAKPNYSQMASKKTENIKPKGIAKAAKMDKPLPKKLDTGKMVEKSIAASKERKAAKKRNRRENLQMAAGALGAIAGTVGAGIKNKRNQIRKGF